MAKRCARSVDLLAKLMQQVIDSLPTAFRRTRLFGPRITFAALLQLCAPSAQTSLHSIVTQLFVTKGQRLGWNQAPDRSSLSRNLRKLTPYLDGVIEKVRSIADKIGRSAHSLVVGSERLIAVDGSWLSLPSSPPLHGEYGTHRNGNARMRGRATYRPQGLLVVLYDVRAGVPIAHELLPFNGGERNALRLVLKHLKRGDTLLMDRGYMSKPILAQLQASGIHFVLRVSTGGNGWREAREFVKRKRRAQNVTFEEHGLKLRLVRATRPRARRGKGSGKTEEIVLATDLNLPIAVIRRLYAARWRIESFFGDLKNLQRIEALHGRDADALKREVVAHFLWFTLAAFADDVIAAADQRTGVFCRANRRVVLVIVACVFDAVLSLRQTPESLGQAMDHQARRRPRSRPGRRFQREAKSPNSKWNCARKGGRKTVA